MLIKRIASLCLLIGIAFTITSCEEGWDKGEQITGIRTSTTDDFRNWKSGNSVVISSNNTNMNSWNIHIGGSTGTFNQNILNNPYHWSGQIKYTEQVKHSHKYKDDECNYVTECEYKEGSTYMEEIHINSYDPEKAWNEVYFRTIGYSAPYNGTFTPTGKESYYVIKTLRPDDFNTLMVYSHPDMTYQFKFVTVQPDNFNEWVTEEMEKYWLNEHAKACMLLVPLLVSVFQY